MHRALTFAPALAMCLLVADPIAAQDLRADNGSIVIGRDVSNSTFNIGVSAEQIAQAVREMRKPYEELTNSQKEIIELLKEKLDLNRRQIAAALNILGEKNVEPENLPAKLVEVAQYYKDLLASAANQPGDTPAIAARKAEAQKALDAGDLDKADELLAAVEAEQQQAFDRAALSLAETSGRRGDLAMTRLRYREAAKHFADAAARLTPGGRNEKERVGYLEKEERALFLQGTDFGEGNAVRSAVERCRALIELNPRDRVPFKWAAAQHRLGVVLVNLGQREKGTARYEEALAAFAEAQKEFTRESRPVRWAVVEMHRGEALEQIGLREQGTARLDESVAAYRAARVIFQRRRLPLKRAWAERDLALALARRGEHGTGTDGLEQAIAAYRRALELYTREESPAGWATVQNELGGALRSLGVRERGTARLEEAVAAYREALKERKRERAPLRWASTQHELADTLVILGRREDGTARLEEAIAVYDEALKERLRERNPGLWAGTSGRQGVALMLLAERTNNARMAERAAAQIEAALDLMRSRENFRPDFLEEQLPRARELVQRLRQP